MFGRKKELTFCAIDIEATGFDPLTEEILEIGFAFFKFDQGEFVVAEEWSQVFKPFKAVLPKILALTGISDEEIDSAPKLSELHEFVQKKIGDAVLVGHSVGVDVKYLEANGFKLSGKYVDTLELVQFVLPTHDSYNLENLMHFFAIPHTEAHRALPDARASIKLLAKLLGIYQGFPEELRSKIEEVVQPFAFAWKELLKVPVLPIIPVSPTYSLDKPLKPGEALVEPGTIAVFQLSDPYQRRILSSLQDHPKRILFVVPERPQVMELWKKGFGTGVFSPEDVFDEEKFMGYISKPQVNPEFARFLLKVLVWRQTNWQTLTTLDLNLSFFGNQFRSLVSGKAMPLPQEPRVIICDQQTLLELVDKNVSFERFTVIQGLAEFEEHLTAGLGRRAGWGHIVRLLTQVYNPETGFGEEALKERVVDLLAATDLFFGLSILALKGKHQDLGYSTFEDLQNDLKAFQSVSGAAANYVEKLRGLAEAIRHEGIAKFIRALSSFFNEEVGRVKWIEFGERHCIFFNYPLNIEPVCKELTDKIPVLGFFDDLTPELAGYFQNRLGFSKLGLVKIPQDPLPRKAALLVGKDLPAGSELMEKLGGNGSVAVILPSYKDIKEFYDLHFRQLQKNFSVFAEGYSGGVNKMFNNFSAVNNGLLLLTHKLVVKSNKRGVTTKTLVIGGLQGDESPSPYSLAVLKDMSSKIANAPGLKMVHNLHRIFQTFYTPELEKIHLYGVSPGDESAPVVEGYLKNLLFIGKVHK